MGLFDKTQKVNLNITSGKQYLNMGFLSSSISMTKNDDGTITFGKLEDRYRIFDYEWEGPKYETITNTTTSSSTKGKSKDKGGRKGHVTGAVIGTLLAPGVGTVIGGAIGTGKKSHGKSKSNTHGKETVTTKDVETKSNATLRVKNIDTGDEFVIGFQCDSKLNTELLNFGIASRQDFIQNVSDQKSSVQLLKEYKELLDAGIISESEFLQKKKELL